MTTISLTPFDAPKNSGVPAFGEDLPCVIAPSTNFPIVPSDSAITAIQGAWKDADGEDGKFLRVGVQGGGCSGLQYALYFTDEVFEDDVITRVDSKLGAVNLVVDVFSASFIEGTELNFVDGVNGSGFAFVNPKAKRSCACGSSFGV